MKKKDGIYSKETQENEKAQATASAIKWLSKMESWNSVENVIAF